MKKILMFASLIILYSSIKSQVRQDWVNLFDGKGNEYCYSISQVFNDFYYVTGSAYLEKVGRTNFMLIKFNTRGDIIWKKFSSSLDRDEMRGITINRQNEVLLSGFRNNYPLIVKMNSNGDTIWSNYMGRNSAQIGQMRVIKTINDTNYVAAGVSGNMFNIHQNKMWLMKLYNNGSTCWSKEYINGYVSNIEITSENDILAIGDNNLLKLNNTGDLLWSKYISGSFIFHFQQIKETKNKDIILVGSSEGCCYPDLCLIKTDRLGNKLWQKMYGGEMTEIAKDVIETADGGFLILGQAPSSLNLGYPKIWLMRTDEKGDTLWTKKYSVTTDPFSSVYPSFFTVSKNNEIFVLGNATTNSSSNNWFVSKHTLLETGINLNHDFIPNDFSLSQNYPNPFNPETTISYSIPKSEHVTLKVYDVLGGEVAILVNEYKNAGTYNSKLNTQNFQLPSGIYFYRLTAGSYSENKKLVLLK